MRKRVALVAAAALAAAVLFARAAAQEPPPQVIRTVVTNVVAPTVVMDQDGRFVNGLTARDFRLYDNDKPQEIRVDVAFQPISLVVAVQANANAESALPRVKKIAPLLDALVVGEQGEVAVLSFDHRIQVLQDFTADADLVRKAFDKIRPGSSTSRLIDAVADASRMLSHRPKDRRRIILVISETRDLGSEGRKREALIATEINNILVYSVNMNRLITTLTAKTPVPRPDPFPVSARPAPAGGAMTPNMVMQNSGTGNVLPLFVEIFRDIKDVFVSNPVELFTKFTGGREYSFITQRDLEDAVARIGEEIHSQYLISYNPNNKLEGGWHQIRVEVMKPGLQVRTRTGYWLAGVPE